MTLDACHSAVRLLTRTGDSLLKMADSTTDLDDTLTALTLQATSNLLGVAFSFMYTPSGGNEGRAMMKTLSENTQRLLQVCVLGWQTRYNIMTSLTPITGMCPQPTNTL